MTKFKKGDIIILNDNQGETIQKYEVLGYNKYWEYYTLRGLEDNLTVRLTRLDVDDFFVKDTKSPKKHPLTSIFT